MNKLHAQAVEAAKIIRERHRKHYAAMAPGCDEEKFWQEGTTPTDIMARYILSLSTPGPSRDAVKLAGDICERRGWNFDIIPALAEELTAAIGGRGDDRMPAMLSQLGDLIRRIGPARRADDIKAALESIYDRFSRPITATQSATTGDK
jgi:hypothetical protein